MKKQLAIAAVVIGLGAFGLNQAYAGWGNGGGMFGGCPNYYQQGPAAMQQVDPAVQDKLEAFFAENQDLQKELVMKRAEQHALMRSDNPDPAAVSKLAGELFDLQAVMRQKAEAAGVAQYLGPMGGRYGSGFGPGACGFSGRGGGRGMGGSMMGGQGCGSAR